MKILLNSSSLIKEIGSKNSKIGLIPTMGGLHEGHLSLVRKAKKQGLLTLVTIFVNPSQFNKKKDYQKYPRNIKKDLAILKKINPNYVFLPKFKDISKFRKNKTLKLNKFHKILCGKFRPGHFQGVLKIIDIFLNLISPKYIFLGEKDYQQLFLIKTFIKKKYSTKIVNCKTIRNKSGFALSTRNKLLNNKELILGSKVYKIIKKFKKKINYSNYKKIINNLKKDIYALGISKIEYLSLIDIDRNIYFNKNSKKYKLFIAYYINKIRFIDNI